MGYLDRRRERKELIMAEATARMKREDERTASVLRQDACAPNSQEELAEMPNEETRMVVRRLQAYRGDILESKRDQFKRIGIPFIHAYIEIGGAAQKILKDDELSVVVRHELVCILNGTGAYSKYDVMTRLLLSRRVIEFFGGQVSNDCCAMRWRPDEQLLSIIKKLYSNFIREDSIKGVMELISMFGKGIREQIGTD